MRIKLAAAARAARDLACAIGILALGSFCAVERSLLWLLPTSAILAGLGWAFYRIELARAGRRARRGQALAAAHGRAKAALAKLDAVEAPAPRPDLFPRNDQKRWLLTEDEMPVAIETNARAAENWMGLGERHDAIAYEPPAWRERKLALRRQRRARDRREAQMDQFDEEHAR